MRVMRSLGVGVLTSLLLVTPGSAAELLPGRCHMDSCTWFSIEKRDIVASSADGALFKATIRTWTSEHPNGSYNVRTKRIGGEASESFFFCSKIRPAVIFSGEKPGTWTASILLPLDEPAGATETATAMYFGVCHGVVPNSDKALTQAAVEFGYKRDGEADQIDLKKPEDIVKPTTAKAP